MEHRWGERIDIEEVPVQLRCLVGAIGAGTIINASFSGAFIRTCLIPPLMARIDILVDVHPVSAFVVRKAPEGIGVEWCNWASEIISALLLSAHSSAASANRNTPRTADPQAFAARGIVASGH